ncbi:hypothetical protein QTN25_010170 [Entamoeba marina]
MSDDETVCFKCNADNCGACVDKKSDECSDCNQGYYLNDTKCVHVTSVDNCATYSTTDDECTSCNDNYWLNDTKCELVTTVDNCAVYSTYSDECYSCASGYGLVDEECSKCTVDNCISCYGDETTCTECNSGYTLHDNKCIECADSNCGTCDSDGKCQLCQEGYFMNKDFTCSKCADWCDQSSNNYDQKCIHSSDNCISSDYECELFDSDGKTCLECDEDFTLDNGKCYHYFSATGYDGKAYGCYSFDVEAYYDTVNDYTNHRYLNFESYEPVDGVCENPYLSKGTGIVVVCVLLVTLLLL